MIYANYNHKTNHILNSTVQIILSCKTTLFKLDHNYKTKWQMQLFVNVVYYILLSEIKKMLSRVREFGDLRQSRSSKKDNLNSSLSSRALLTPKSELSKTSSMNSHYICINCINQQMSSNKKCQDQQRQAAENSRYLDLERSRRAFESDLARSREKKQEEHKQKILDFNKSLIDSHEKQRQEEQRARQNARKRQEQDAITHQKMLQQDLAKKQNAKNLFRNDLEQQIQQKKEQKLREQMKSRYAEPLPQDQNWGEITKQQKERYRQELQNQIRQSKQKKQRERQNQSLINQQQENFLGDLIASNNKKQRQTENQIKRQLQEDENEYRKNQEAKRKEKMQKLQQEKLEALINQQFQEKQQQENRIIKNERINRYKKDIEEQIRQNEQRRNKLKYSNKTYFNSTMGLTQAQIERRLCDSCEKTYPKKYMTKVKH